MLKHLRIQKSSIFYSCETELCKVKFQIISEKIIACAGHEINFFGKEPSGSQIFQSGRQGQKVRSQ